MKEHKIYSLKEPDSDIVKYIGLTKHSLHQRLRKHITHSKSDKRRTPKADWIKSLIGKNAKPVIELIEDNLSFEEAVKKECFYIMLFRSFGAPLKNLAHKGVNKGFKMPEEAKKRISEHNKMLVKEGKHNFLTIERRKKGEYKASDETKAKLKVSRKNRKIEPHLGKKHSIEAKLKMSLAHIGRKHSVKHRLALSKARKGIPCNNNKPIIAVNLSTGENQQFRTYKDVSSALNISVATIWRSLKKKSNPKKYKFEYVQD